MSTSLRNLRCLEIVIYPSANRKHWVAHCLRTHLTAWGWSRDRAEEALRKELDVEEQDEGRFPPGPALPTQREAEKRTIERRAKGWWAR